MLPWFEPAAIFLGAIGGTAFLLVAIYFCIKSDKCFCNVNGSDSRDDTPDIDYVQVATEDSATEVSGHTSPAALAPIKDAIYAVSTPNIASGHNFSSDDEANRPGVSDIGQPVDDSASGIPKPPKAKKGASKKRSASMENITRVSNGNVHLSLHYSNKDLFLFVVIHNVTELNAEAHPGVDQVRISMVLLPAKKYRSKTKFMPIDQADYGASFKFSNVSREDLFQSALRLRLYGRHVKLGMHLGKEKLLGEVTVHLADVAQKVRITTSRPFRLPSKQ